MADAERESQILARSNCIRLTTTVMLAPTSTAIDQRAIPNADCECELLDGSPQAQRQ